MIGKLKGRIESLEEDGIILDVGGVGYVVYLSAKSLAALGNMGEAASLLIDTHVREDHIHLYGFVTLEEQAAFRLLCTVQGVGAKMALAILGTFHPSEIAQAIAAKDTKMLTRASGVGSKLAERIVTELKNKAVKLAGGTFAPVAATATPTKGKAAAKPVDESEAALSALVNLGYGRSEAFAALSLVRQKNPEFTSLEALIKGGLQELAR
jgi:Holliday junction DNA helicase RuvA